LLALILLVNRNVFSEEGSSLRKFEKAAVHRDKDVPAAEKPAPPVCDKPASDTRLGFKDDESGCEADSFGAMLICVVFEPIFKFAVTAPFTLPRNYIGAPEKEPLYFEPYPFYGSKSALVRHGSQRWLWSLEGTHQWARHKVQGDRETASLLWSGGWGGRVSRVDYSEKTRQGRERLALNEALGYYNFAQSRSTYFRGGIGLATLEGQHHRTGIKFLYGVGTAGKPIQAGLEAALTGGMGSSPMTEMTYHASYHIGRAAFVLKYRYLSVRDQVIKGPEIGLQWWL
jgi:hypothetical protein